MNINLEALIEEHAKIMADQMGKAVEWAGSEEDIRHECNKLIDEFIQKAGLTVKGRHEYGLAGGRIDSKYGGVVIEYKDPKGSGKITEDKNAPGVKAVVQQIEQRFRDLQAKEHVGMERILGIGCDGDTFVFVRQRGRQTEAEDPQPVTAHTVERLLRAIVSLGARGLSFTPENLAAHFGSESTSAREGVRHIHQIIHETDNPKAQTFFRQWQILFGEVCGYDIHGQNAKVRNLAEHYRVADPNPAELLFAVHTYYALFIKLLAAEIVASFSPLGTSTLKKLVAAPTSAKLRDELRALEQGGIWSQLGIRNFLEGDLFSWYLDAWDDRCAEAIRSMTRSLDEFDPTTLSVDPAESRDLLKQLYQQLFPKSVRHDLGEYYTPDWLAELVLNELGYDGNPDKRLLDPACGSGTFLVMALNRVKTWYAEHRHQCGFGEDELLRKVLRNIIGFDLNPLAVMAARTNYLMAIRDLLRHADNVELPVYLCDSIMMPHVAGSREAQKIFLSESAVAYDTENPPIALPSAAGTFLIPREIAADRDSLARYADTLEFCVRNRYSPQEFLERCQAEGIPATEAELHKGLYRQLQQLDADNRNRVWPWIIKNAFAPLFVGKVDYVAGNPPWVNWENLPNDYRQSTAPLWQEYDLFRHKGYRAKLGGGKDDVSILMTYVAHDAYLNEDGRLGFVITQSVFKTVGGGEGFRTLQYTRGGKTYHLPPLVVHDLSDFQPFEGATNRTAVVVLKKSKRPFSYPVPYIVWRKEAKGKIWPQMSLDEVLESTSRKKMGAQPVQANQPTSPWLTAPKRALSGIQKVIGKSDYRAYEGVNTGGLNGCFWIRVIDQRPNGDLLIENLHDVGKIKVKQVQAVIEPDLVYPLLRGRDVRRWHAEPSAHIILANRTDKLAGIPEATMKQQYPKTYAYLKQFEGNRERPQRGTLRARATSAVQNQIRAGGPFYCMFGVGAYTMAKWKVVWSGEVALEMNASVVSVDRDARVILNDQTAYQVPFSEEEEAHYFCALLNCIYVRAFYRFVAYKHTSMNFFQGLRIELFPKQIKEHRSLSNLSQRCHTAAAKGDADAVAALEAEIDAAAAKIWGITDDELRAIQDALADSPRWGAGAAGMSPRGTATQTQDESEEE